MLELLVVWRRLELLVVGIPALRLQQLVAVAVALNAAVLELLVVWRRPELLVVGIPALRLQQLVAVAVALNAMDLDALPLESTRLMQ